MFINSKKAEEAAILNLAYSVCAAARTAPKACGIDLYRSSGRSRFANGVDV